MNFTKGAMDTVECSIVANIRCELDELKRQGKTPDCLVLHWVDFQKLWGEGAEFDPGGGWNNEACRANGRASYIVNGIHVWLGGQSGPKPGEIRAVYKNKIGGR